MKDPDLPLIHECLFIQLLFPAFCSALTHSVTATQAFLGEGLTKFPPESQGTVISPVPVVSPQLCCAVQNQSQAMYKWMRLACTEAL